MAAPKGNQFWKARSSHGRKPIFENPEDLWKACVEYFEWVDDNPLLSSELVKFQGDAKTVTLSKMRAMTISGLCVFLDIVRQTWENYRTSDDFLDITTRVEEIIKVQKFEGAAADLLNPSIIARDLNLVDKNELSGPGGKPLEITETSAAERLNAMLDKLAPVKNGSESA